MDFKFKPNDLSNLQAAIHKFSFILALLCSFLPLIRSSSPLTFNAESTCYDVVKGTSKCDLVCNGNVFDFRNFAGNSHSLYQTPLQDYKPAPTQPELGYRNIFRLSFCGTTPFNSPSELLSRGSSFDVDEKSYQDISGNSPSWDGTNGADFWQFFDRTVWDNVVGDSSFGTAISFGRSTNHWRFGFLDDSRDESQVPAIELLFAEGDDALCSSHRSARMYFVCGDSSMEISIFPSSKNSCTYDIRVASFDVCSIFQSATPEESPIVCGANNFCVSTSHDGLKYYCYGDNFDCRWGSNDCQSSDSDCTARYNHSSPRYTDPTDNCYNHNVYISDHWAADACLRSGTFASEDTNIVCGGNNFCVNTEMSGTEVYCYGDSHGCLWGSNDCLTDVDCRKYDSNSDRYINTQESCHHVVATEDRGWTADACSRRRRRMLLNASPSGQPSSEPSLQPSSQPSSPPSAQPVLDPSSAPSYNAEDWGQITWSQRRFRHEGRCNFDCWGHGTCLHSGVCECFLGLDGLPEYMGIDCSMRTCPSGMAWVGGVVNANDLHPMAECSNKGTCQRTDGTCSCFAGYDGNACQRTVCPDNCFGRGQCMTEKHLAKFAGRVYEQPWDAVKHVGCVCDMGFRGPACDQRECPSGPDPMGGHGNEAGRDCAGRGICDYKTGMCSCFSGFYGLDCSKQTTIL